jgi:hypothetical protein
MHRGRRPEAMPATVMTPHSPVAGASALTTMTPVSPIRSAMNDSREGHSAFFARARKAAAALEERSRALTAAIDEITVLKEGAIEQVPVYTIYLPDGCTIRVSRFVVDALQAGGLIYSDHGTLHTYAPSSATASDDRSNRARTRSTKSWRSRLLAFWPKWPVRLP